VTYSWSQPSDSGGAPIIGYLVQYSDGSGSYTLAEHFSDSSGSLSVNNVDQYSVVELVVHAMNDADLISTNLVYSFAASDPIYLDEEPFYMPHYPDQCDESLLP
jgi:hypothetical protein